MPNDPDKAQTAYLAAQKMSNWLYNVSQLPEAKLLPNASLMMAMVREWDEAKGYLAKLTVARKKRASHAK